MADDLLPRSGIAAFTHLHTRGLNLMGTCTQNLQFPSVPDKSHRTQSAVPESPLMSTSGGSAFAWRTGSQGLRRWDESIIKPTETPRPNSARLAPAMNADGQPLPGLVVVPRRPGPLILPPPSDPAERDEVDVELDQLFGPPIQQGPGALDAALVVGGVAIIAFAVALHGGGGLLVLGVGCLLLGLALPVRSLWRGLQRRRSAGRLAATLRRGDPLNRKDAQSRRLAVAYTKILGLDSEGDPAAEEAVAACLRALQEVAVLLRGRSRQGAAESEYIARRIVAVEGLACSLVSSARYGEGAARDSAAEALSEFEERTGMSSLDRIESLRAAGRSLRRR
jgi:hypothetical protein